MKAFLLKIFSAPSFNRSIVRAMSSIDAAKAKAHVPEPSLYKYNSRDAIIYALGIGANTKDDLHFIYESHPKFQVFPTFVVAPGLLANSLSDWPGLQFDLSKVLHGEQYIELFDQMPSDGAELRTETRIIDVLDKGSSAVILSETTTYDNHTNKKLAKQQFAIVQLGSGNFGGNRTSPAECKAPSVPNSSPDKIFEERVNPDQAALYRLGSGDLNPLHIDSAFAKVVGFDRPILHGLCSLGIATRFILREYASNDAANLRSIKVRFSAPVVPGQTLQVEAWRDPNQKKGIHFQAKVKETGKLALGSGYILLNKDPDQIQQQSPSSANKESVDIGSTKNLKSRIIFETIDSEMQKPENKQALAKINAIVVYDITKDSKHAAYFTLDLKNGHASAYEGQPKAGDKPAVTVTVDDDDFLKITTGKLNGTKAFLTGKLKAKGQIMLLQKLQGILSKAGKSKI